ADIVVVADDWMPVDRQTNVEFKTITSVSECQIKRIQSVLGNELLSSGTAVTKKQWTNRHGDRFYWAVC
ncbi:MAG: hypothetical protein WCD48_02380, partial [Candidatus Sulfotelmatobacter sp.]